MNSGPLTAFYDLSVCPVTYDFVVFMALVEMTRRRQGCAELHVVVVPGISDGFRDDDVSYSAAAKIWRLRNIVIPSCWLFNDSVSVTICDTRAEAETIEAAADSAVFPLGYTTKHPIGDFLWSGVSAALACGETVPQARPSEEARRIVGDWLAARCEHRNPVTITLRESSHASVRNSDRTAWLEFAQGLDPDLYLPIIVPDTEHAFVNPSDDLNGTVIWPAAALNLDLRLALYERSWLNLMVPNGPGILCWFSKKSRFIMFKMINNEWVNTTTAYVSALGLKIGGQLPHAAPFQRLVWEPDTRETIEREFGAMAVQLKNSTAVPNPADEPAIAEEPMAIAVRLQAHGRLEDATTIYQHIVTAEPNNADAWHMLGIIAHQAKRPDAAEKMMLRAISLRPAQANYHINLAAVMREAERHEEAANCLWRAITLAPQDAGARADLAEVMHALGDDEKAKAEMISAIRLKPNSQILCERGARLLHTLGYKEEAADLFRCAIDIRNAELTQARLRRGHMPEIPIATLTTT